MVSPISSRARKYVRSRATSVMDYECRIERVSKATYGEDLKATAGGRVVVYEGVCRVWEVSGTSSITLGDSDMDISTTQLSTPYDAPVARKNDEVVITNTPAQDTSLAGKRFQIQSYAKAGELRATRRYAVMAVAK